MTGDTGLLRATAACLIVLALADCGGVSDVAVPVPGHRADASGGVLADVPPRNITVRDFTMDRGIGVLPGRIGERTTVGNVSMGYVTIVPPPEALFTDAISSELAAAGHRITGGPSVVSGTVQRFALSTPATATYWDVTIDAALKVSVNGITRSYADLCVQRTATWPSDMVIARVASACVDRIAAKFRADTRVANAL